MICDNTFVSESSEEADRAARPEPRAQLRRRPSGTASSSSPASRSPTSAAWSGRSRSSRGSPASTARARTPRACASCSATASSTAGCRCRRSSSRESSASGDHRRQRHAARRPGPDRQRGPLPRPAQQGATARTSSPASRRARAARTSRASRSSTRSRTPSTRPARTRALIFVPARFAADAIYEAVDAGIGTVICITEHVPAHEMLRAYTYFRPQGRHDDRPELPGRALAGQGERRDHPGRDLQRGRRSGSSRAPAR